MNSKWILLLILLTNCASPDPKREARMQLINTEAAQRQAIDEFIAQSYPEWKRHGISSLDCPCDIHLMHGEDNKIVTVMLKDMTAEDGQYWAVWEARPSDFRVRDMEDCKDLLDDARPPDESLAY